MRRVLAVVAVHAVVLLEACHRKYALPDEVLLAAKLGPQNTFDSALHREARDYFNEQNAEGPNIVAPWFDVRASFVAFAFASMRQIVE